MSFFEDHYLIRFRSFFIAVLGGYILGLCMVLYIGIEGFVYLWALPIQQHPHNHIQHIAKLKTHRCRLYWSQTILISSFQEVDKPVQFAPRRAKTCLQGFRQSETQTSLLSYRDSQENRNFGRSKSRYDTFK